MVGQLVAAPVAALLPAPLAPPAVLPKVGHACLTLRAAMRRDLAARPVASLLFPAPVSCLSSRQLTLTGDAKDIHAIPTVVLHLLVVASLLVNRPFGPQFAQPVIARTLSTAAVGIPYDTWQLDRMVVARPSVAQAALLPDTRVSEGPFCISPESDSPFNKLL